MKRVTAWVLHAILILILLPVMSGCGGGGSKPPTSTISGVVGEARYGNPIAGATVEIISTTRANTPSALLQATTDDSGTYSIAGIPAGKVRIRVVSQDGSFRPLETEVDLSGGTTLTWSPYLIESDAAEPVSLSVEPQDLTADVGDRVYLSLYVTPYAKPFLWVEGDVGLVNVNSEGEFIATKPGVGVVVVQAGNLTARAKVSVGVTGVYGVVRGSVTDPAGKPVPHASISTTDHIVTQTDASGTFVIPWAPGGKYTLIVTASGYEDFQDVVTVTPDQTTTVNWKLRPRVYDNLRISPSSATLGVGDTGTFAVSADNDGYPYMKFSILEPDGGSLDPYPSYVYGAQTRYTAPNTPGAYHLIAVSATDPNQKVTATITVQAGSSTVVVE